MSVIAEVAVDADEFGLGRALAAGPPAQVELERLVPDDGSSVPYVWVASDDQSGFERALRRQSRVGHLQRLDRIGDQALYRIDWTDSHDFLEGILAADGAILEAHGGEEWLFQLRFDDHERLATFYNYCMAHDITIRITRVFTLTEEYRRGRLFGLTPEQREALVLAAERGYFETPSKVTLEEVGRELGISSQAASKRIRGGVEKLVNEGLLTAP
jgi:predicted DNA binding protein